MDQKIFDELFVLEIANNHWGKVDRGLKIISTYNQIVRFNGVRAALKLQIRDVPSFIHKDFLGRTDIRYIKKTLDTALPFEGYAALVEAIRKGPCIPMATPFDEASVDTCMKLGIPLLKIASYDINDWFLIERIAATRKPVIVSTGGASLKETDDIVSFFEKRNIPLAINHCVSLYPTEDDELELNQLDFLRMRYPGHVIGLSTHEYHDWTTSMYIAYAKGARTFERHVDIEMDGVSVSPYCSLPAQIDTWFKAFEHAKRACGVPSSMRRIPQSREIEYLNALVRGVYAKRDLPAGYMLEHGPSLWEDVYLAIPLQKGQISCRELMSGEVLLKDIAKDQPIMIDAIDCPYAHDERLRSLIFHRGL
ncbi:MAG TPA: N-acetylneuraminate synthase family protein [Polyangiaceae bacterium]|nr:N-acetylneuraminate synthase family protein [Polyangiaceae bacterium]HNZ23478.1 N-acetylneuraminate synthase family protein [Polyangiaceae bacterium]HOE51945.1 N-acetylneuraminate synthase family protein [Polyangiaceae bacterium]HOH01249.1 N-acetylneuraminate synthase family protein [Polyangiaceae bacterium]HOR35175.1 N-acetylneuraminate synthase family protein [Polyangiaceae bacterium]